MRIFCLGVLLVCLVSSASAQKVAVTVLADNSPALQLLVPQNAKVFPEKAKTVIHTTNMFLHIWPVPGAKTVAEAQAGLAELIKGDVLKFKATQTNALAIAGAPAVHLAGEGVEADDGDPARADLVIFTVNDCAFVACVHGEGNDASLELGPMMAVLQTAGHP